MLTHPKLTVHAVLDNFIVWFISRKDQEVNNWKQTLLTAITPAFDEKKLVNFGPLTKKF